MLELHTGLEAPTTWMAAVPAGAGRTATLTEAGGDSLHSLTAGPVGQSSLPAHSDRMEAQASQVQQQAVQDGANASEPDVDELFMAVDANDVEKVRQLLVAGTDPNAHTLNVDQTPLHIAANGRGDGHVEIIRLLLAAGAKVDAASEDGHTPLSVALMKGDLEIVQQLLAAGAAG